MLGVFGIMAYHVTYSRRFRAVSSKDVYKLLQVIGMLYVILYGFWDAFFTLEITLLIILLTIIPIFSLFNECKTFIVDCFKLTLIIISILTGNVESVSVVANWKHE